MESQSTQRSLTKRRLSWLILLALLALIAWLGWRQTANQPRASVTAPAVKNLAAGQTQIVPIEIDTAGQTINAAQVLIKFDPQVVQVQATSVEGSVFTIQITGEPKFDNQAGTISFAGGLPTPGFKGKGKIGSITLIGQSAAKTTLTFDPSTQMLLNDGQGTAVPLRLEPIEVNIK